MTELYHRHTNIVIFTKTATMSHLENAVGKYLYLRKRLVKELYPRSLDCTANMGYCFGYIKLI